MFANSFVSLLVGGYVCYWLCQFVGLGGYVWYWVCLFVGWWLCDNIISFKSRDGVSVFYYRFKAIPRILNYKWADYWPYWEFIYQYFSMWPSVVYLFHVWGGVGVGLF